MFFILSNIPELHFFGDTNRAPQQVFRNWLRTLNGDLWNGSFQSFFQRQCTYLPRFIPCILPVFSVSSSNSVTVFLMGSTLTTCTLMLLAITFPGADLCSDQWSQLSVTFDFELKKVNFYYIARASAILWANHPWDPTKDAGKNTRPSLLSAELGEYEYLYSKYLYSSTEFTYSWLLQVCRTVLYSYSEYARRYLMNTQNLLAHVLCS